MAPGLLKPENYLLAWAALEKGKRRRGEQLLPLRARTVVVRVTLHTHLADIPKLLSPKTSIAQRYLGLYPCFLVYPAHGGTHG